MCPLIKLPKASKIKEVMVQSGAKVWPKSCGKPMLKNKENLYKSLRKNAEVNTTIFSPQLSEEIHIAVC